MINTNGEFYALFHAFTPATETLPRLPILAYSFKANLDSPSYFHEMCLEYFPHLKHNYPALKYVYLDRFGCNFNYIYPIRQQELHVIARMPSTSDKKAIEKVESGELEFETFTIDDEEYEGTWIKELHNFSAEEDQYQQVLSISEASKMPQDSVSKVSIPAKLLVVQAIDESQLSDESSASDTFIVLAVTDVEREWSAQELFEMYLNCSKRDDTWNSMKASHFVIDRCLGNSEQKAQAIFTILTIGYFFAQLLVKKVHSFIDERDMALVDWSSGDVIDDPSWSDIYTVFKVGTFRLNVDVDNNDITLLANAYDDDWYNPVEELALEEFGKYFNAAYYWPFLRSISRCSGNKDEEKLVKQESQRNSRRHSWWWDDE